jgi:hypothetical protein
MNNKAGVLGRISVVSMLNKHHTNMNAVEFTLRLDIIPQLKYYGRSNLKCVE